jgi:hypothetical protein
VKIGEGDCNALIAECGFPAYTNKKGKEGKKSKMNKPLPCLYDYFNSRNTVSRPIPTKKARREEKQDEQTPSLPL